MDTTVTISASSESRAPARGRRRILVLIVGLILLAVSCAASLAIGSKFLPVDEVIHSLTHPGSGAADTSVVITLRLPRTAIALAVGVALGVAGALVQAVTRNPLADPGLLGVSSGSAFAVALAVGFFGLDSAGQYVWFAFGGALVATVVVSIVGGTGRGPASPARLTLAGLAFGAVLSGITSSIVLSDPSRFESIQAWQSGSLTDRSWDVLLPVVPFLAVGVVLAAALGRPLNAIVLGDEQARALGVPVTVVRVLAVVALTLLAGGATAIAGPIAFVGLMIPHVARFLVGPDQRWILVLTIVLAPSLLLIADIIGRVVDWPGEIPAGLVTAAVGAPVLIYLVRRRKASAP
ncbi:MAG: transporter permease [Frondihabitans sp.]|nr:transporter permease [Frondihabitans sp.]